MLLLLPLEELSVQAKEDGRVEEGERHGQQEEGKQVKIVW
jgi:hypothetical protein